MSTKYKFHDQDKLYFVSFAVVNWIDLFIRNEYKDIMLDSFRYCQQQKGLDIYGWCIMPSHIHLIIATEKGNLSDIIRDLKRHTSKLLLKTISENVHESRREWMMWMFGRAGKRNTNNEQYQFWQQNNHPVELSTAEMFDQRLNYLHYNPVESGAVRNPPDCLYSSAIDYYTEEKGLLSIAGLS